MIAAYPSILKYRANTHPERLAYIFENNNYTYAQYYNEAVKTANYLRSLGLKKGDRIGILDLNNAAVVNLVTGAMFAGIIPVSANWKSMPAELSFIPDDAGIEHFFYGAAFANLIKATQFSASVQLHRVETLNEIFKSDDKINFHEEYSSDDVCVILYTSGTTGNPKGVMLTYNNVFNCYYYCASDTPSFGPDTRNLVCGPLYSIFGFGAFFSCIYSGATNVLVRMFDAALVAATISASKVTNALLVPIMIRMIVSLEGVEQMDFSSLKHVQYGGSPVSPDVLIKASKLFGCYFTQVYGLTETSGVATSLRFDDHLKILSGENILQNKLLLSAGKAGLGVEIKIVDEEGNAAATNEPGEVWIKGEVISKGYWNRTNENAQTFTKDGWCKTGDVGYMNEDGYLFLVDRKNDKIVSKGVNIYPAEVEKVLEQYPKFKEVAVVGTPDENAGEVICVVAVLKDNETNLIELCDWCKDKIAPNKLPKRLEIRKELPRNPTGKILRKLIREPFWIGEERKIKG